MKFRIVVIITGLSVCGWISAAAPTGVGDTLPAGQEESFDRWITDLADEDFRTREEATRKLWDAGEAALPSLQTAVNGEDPEKSFRAGELIRKIQLSITPDTDPAVVAMVERYARSSTNEKMNLLNQMIRKRAWRQILRLYATEKNPEVRARFQDSAKSVAIHAARECLLAGDPRAARDFLELAPADAAGLLALADFHRSQGTLEDELKRAESVKGRNSEAWKLALHRVAGDLEAAREAAAAAGEVRIGTGLSVLLGDPLPWIRADLAGGGENSIRKQYTALVVKQWQGKEIRQSEIEPFVRAAASRGESDRQLAIASLFLLGETQLAEAALIADSPFGAFKHFDTLERIPEALAALNLDPKTPNFAEWVGKRIEHLADVDAGDEHDVSTVTDQLVTMANFLERRGLVEEADAAFVKPLEELAKSDVVMFLEFLDPLFGDQESLSGAPQLSKRIGYAWAGDDGERWSDLIDAAFGEEDEPLSWWEWLEELAPESSHEERFDGMLALFNIGPDPAGLAAMWLERAWTAIDAAPADSQPVLIARISYLVSQVSDRGGNVQQALKAWDKLPDNARGEIFWGGHILNLSAAGRWGEAADIFAKQIARATELKHEPRPDTYAYTAACLRQAGRDDEAIAYDAWADNLVLGNTESAIQIGHAYAYGRDYKRAVEWWERAARQCDPDSGEFTVALQLLSDHLLERGDWETAAAANEVLAQTYSSPDYGGMPALSLLRLRMQSDMARAIAGLKEDRNLAIAILERCHQLFPSDGSLADGFFPALRKVGLIAEHDKWFESSWKMMSEVVKRYPASENTYNTAGWLASRAQRRLVEAEAFLEIALGMNPDQPAYLDTMAEIQFAMGDRDEAMEWSQLAVNFAPQDSMIRKQQERFRTEPMPR